MAKLLVKTVSKPERNAVPVFFLSDGAALDKAFLFSKLFAEERAYLSNAAIRREIGLIKEGNVKVFIAPGTGRRIIVIGIGRKKDFTMKKAAMAFRMMIETARKERASRICFGAEPMGAREETIDSFEVAVSNAIMSNFEFVDYRTPPADGFFFVGELQAAIPSGISKTAVADIKEGIRRGTIIGEETNACRALQNTPGGDMTPDILAKHAIAVARRNPGVKASVLDAAAMKRLGMGGVLAVGQGSAVPPRFIILEYLRGSKNEKPAVLVGKGVTFDTGGLNLKSSEHIYEMHMDMSGGAAVIHTLAAAARLGVKKNIVALVPAVENMPSGSSYRPGDLIRTMNGKTIEVLNTDAEGRVILSDALEYAKKYDPAIVIDVATLTGAAMRALGWRYSALFTPDKALETEFRLLGDVTADPVWPLPISEEFEADIKGTFADWANAGKPNSAGASNGAVFLWQFTKDAAGTQCYPWVHLDIAPRMTASEEEHLAKGALGTPIRLLARFLEKDSAI